MGLTLSSSVETEQRKAEQLPGVSATAAAELRAPQAPIIQPAPNTSSWLKSEDQGGGVSASGLASFGGVSEEEQLDALRSWWPRMCFNCWLPGVGTDISRALDSPSHVCKLCGGV